MNIPRARVGVVVQRLKCGGGLVYTVRFMLGGEGRGFKGTSRTLNDGREKFMASFDRGLIV